MDSPAPQRSRILVVDDNREIHADFRKLLAGDAAPSESERDGLDALDAIIGVDAEEVATEQIFDVDSADQGRKALLMVEAAVAEGRPYSLAFVDMRMPPGWDGLETIDHLVAVDPRMQIVICTAYSDHDWDDIHARVGHVDNVLVLKKPFDAIEARQMAWALCKKWSLARESERKQEE
ncbi:MAG: response regulator, partial [Planctomycetota bacterium]